MTANFSEIPQRVAMLVQHPNACWVMLPKNMSLSAVFLVMAAISKGDETIKDDKAHQPVEFHSFPWLRLPTTA